MSGKRRRRRKSRLERRFTGRLGGRQYRQRNRAGAMIDFWVSIGSTYSYLAVMRLGAVED
jgi:hypothetical protein